MNELAPRPSLQDRPRHGLVSLWDMLRLNGSAFHELIACLNEMQITVISHGPDNAVDRPLAQGSAEDLELSDALRRKIVWMRTGLSAIGARNSDREASRLQSALKGKTCSLAQANKSLAIIADRLRDEMEDVALYVLKPEGEKLYKGGLASFGVEVMNAFPSAAEDIDEAGKCLAFRRSTACVMHLMRALEIPLRAMAAAVGVSMTENWNSVLNEIEKRLRNKDDTGNRVDDGFWRDRKDELDFYTEAATTFFFFKNAWRNYAMHGRDTYTEEKAEEIYNSVRTFFRHLSQRIGEPSAISETDV